MNKPKKQQREPIFILTQKKISTAFDYISGIAAKCYKFVVRQIEAFAPILRIIELLLLSLALYIGYSSFKTSNEFANNVERHLGKIDSLFQSVEIKLTNIPLTISKIDSSISNLNSAIDKQQSIFENSVLSLKAEMDEFSNSLSGYRQLLENITLASDKQLSLLRETQKQWETELGKKANLHLSLEDVKDIGGDTLQIFFILENMGDKFAQHVGISLYISRPIEFISRGWVSWEMPKKSFIGWTYMEVPFMPFSSKPKDWAQLRGEWTNFKLFPKSKLKSPVKLHYIIYCDVGSFEDTLTFKF